MKCAVCQQDKDVKQYELQQDNKTFTSYLCDDCHKKVESGAIHIEPLPKN